MNIFRFLHPEEDGNSGGSGDGGAAVADGAGGAVETPAWIDVLPEEAKTDPNVTKFKTSDDFYKSFKTQNELVGRKGVIIPKDDASPEEQGKFYNSLGRPEKAEGYKFEPIQNLDPSLKWDKNVDDGLANLFHERGLPQKTANALRADFAGMLNTAAKGQIEREQTAMKTAETALRQEWGADFDANRAMVARGVMAAGGQEAIDAMGGEKGLGNNPIVLKTLAKVFKGMGEDQMKAFEQGGGGLRSGNETKEQALSKIQAMMNDPSNPINDEKSPKRQEALDERMRLYKIAYPEGEQQ